MHDSAMEFMKSTSFKGSVPGLERLEELLSLLGNPEKELKYIHVTGTNGKGSVCKMMSEIFRTAGYRTGLFTSPCLVSVNEQIRIDNNLISDEDYTYAAKKLQSVASNMTELPTEFELLVAAAILHFTRYKCDIVIMETGMGGTLDATNVIPSPEAAVITSIGYDHMQYLGNSLEEIAGHKAGIIKRGTKVIYQHTADLEASAAKQIINRARQQGARLYSCDSRDICIEAKDTDGYLFTYKNHKNIKIKLLGEHQVRNAALVLETVDNLKDTYSRISEEIIRKVLAEIFWPARFEVIPGEIVHILDGGHNSQCIRAVTQTLEDLFPGERFIIVTGVMADKDYDGMYRLLNRYAAAYVAVTPDNKRALPAADLKRYLEGKTEVRVYQADLIAEGLDMADKLAANGQKVCVIGSLYMMGEVRSYYSRKNSW